MSQNTFSVLLVIHSGVGYCTVLEGSNTRHDIQKLSVPMVPTILRIEMFHWKSFAVTDQSRKTIKLYDLHYMVHTNVHTHYEVSVMMQ